MPLCTFYSLRIILMSVIFLHSSKLGILNYFAAAAPLQTSHSESREENIESALKETVSDEYRLEGAPVELQRTDLLQNARDEKKLASFALDDPSVPSPENVQLAFMSISSVLITWTYPARDHAHFVVQMSYDGDPYKNVSDLLNSTQFVYSEMKYSAYYQFRVTAYLGGVASTPTETNYFINGVTAPPGPPTNVMAIVMSYDISLQWDAPSTPSPLLYLVDWGTNETQLDRKATIAQTTHFTFKNLEPGQTYYFRVTADINSWLSIPSSVVQQATPPPNLPAVMVSVNVSDKWALIIWSDPPKDRHPTTVNQFQVYYSSNLHQEKTIDYFNHSATYNNVTVVEPSQRTFNLSGLAPGSVWAVRVAYVSGKFMSNLSTPVLLETLEDVVCSACEPLSSTQFRVSWQVFTTLSKNRTVKVLEGGNLVSNLSTSKTKGELTVSGLHPWSSHSFVVTLETTSAVLPSGPCPVLNCWTKEAAPSQPPTDIRATVLSSRSVLLIWTQPPLNSQNGLITKYTIGYQCAPRFSTQECNTHQLNTAADSPSNLSLVIDSLVPYTSYSFVVAASTSAGKGPFSFPLTVVTAEEAPDAPPSNLSITNITATSFLASWIPPPIDHQHGLITNYRVFLTIGCQTLSQERGLDLKQQNEKIVIQSGTRTDLLVDGLIPMTEYMVQVSARTDVGESPFSDVVCVSTSQSAKSLPINVNFTTTLVNHANEESMCYNLTFQWNSPLPLYNSTLRLKHVEISEWTTFIKYSFSTDSDKQNGTILVGHNAHVSMLTVSGLNESTLIEGRTGLFWLEIDITLSNGTVLSLYSPHKLASIPICGGSTGSYADWKIAVLCVGVLACCVLLSVSSCGCLLYKLKKSYHNSSQSAFRMNDIVPSETEENDYLLDPTLRISDGRSSVSSSAEEESTRTSSESLNFASDASMMGQCHSDNDSDLLDLTLDSPLRESPASPPAAHASGMSEQGTMPKGYVVNLDSLEAESRPHSAPPLAPRQNPDGCSLSSSSSSSESVALPINEQ